MRLRFFSALPAAVLIAAGLLGAGAGSVAAGGGGCHERTITDRQAVAVDLKGNCFFPTVVRVEPGTEVTWTNRDDTLHTVTGVGQSWGTYDDVTRGKSVSYRFEQSGVFPYFCLYHPGMVGAVVVGDGAAASGAVAGATAPSKPVASAQPAQPRLDGSAAEQAPASARDGGASGELQPLPVLAAAGLALLGALAGWAVATLPKRRTTSP